ncbi:MAG: hypothetical protein WBC63_00645 [Candidatus Bipolaricaulia bacterium]
MSAHRFIFLVLLVTGLLFGITTSLFSQRAPTLEDDSFAVEAEDDSFAADLDGRKTWTLRYGFGHPIGLASAGLAAGHLSLDQTLRVDLRAEALSILTVEGRFDDQRSDSLQSLSVYLDTERLDGVFGDFSVDGLSGFSTQRRKMMGGQLDYLLGDATLTAVASRFEGITESRTFVGQTAESEAVYSAVLRDRPWIEQPYARGINGLYSYALETLYVEELSTVELALTGSDGVRSVLRAYGLEYVIDILLEEPATDLASSSFLVVGDPDQTLLLTSIPQTLIRNRLEDAIDAFNERNDASGSDRRTYPFVAGSEYETSFLDALGDHASLRVDDEEHPILAGVRRRFYDLGQTGILDPSVVVEVTSDGTAFTPITRPELAAYEATVHPGEGILEIDFPDAFFTGERAAIRVRFAYTVTGGSYMLGFSLVPGSERVTVNDVPLTEDDYEIDYEIGLLILMAEVAETDVIHVEYERFGGGLGGTSDYARYFLGLTLDLPVSDALELTATVQRGADDPDSVTDPSRVRTMPNRQTVAGVLGSVALDGLDGNFAVGYGVDEFPLGDNERPPSPNEVTVIAGDDEYLFVGHQTGFSLLHDDAWRGYGTSDGLSGRSVRAIAVGEDQVFFGTNAGLTVVALAGAAPFDRVDSWSRYGEYDGLSDPSIRGLLLLEDRLWIGSEGGLFSVEVETIDDPSSWMTLDLPELATITALAEDGDAIYIGTEAGVYRHDPASNETGLLAGTAGLHVHSLTSDGDVLYVSSERGLRAYRGGVGTGWVTVGAPVYAATVVDDDLYFGTDEGMIRASDEAEFHGEWRITALGLDTEGSLWVGSRADEDYVLILWQHGSAEIALDNTITKIDGRDTTSFGVMIADEHTVEGLFGRAWFRHEADGLSLSGSIAAISPGYRAIGDAAGSGSTDWELDVALAPRDGFNVSATHEYSAREGSHGAAQERTENNLAFFGSFGPTVSFSAHQESANTDPFVRGPESGAFSYRFSVDESLFASVLDLSLSWSDSISTDHVAGTTTRQNRLSAGAVLDLPAGATVSADWVRPLRTTDEGWIGREEWSFGGDWAGQLPPLGTVALDGALELSRRLPDGTIEAVTSAELDIDIDSFDLGGWRFTPTTDLSFEREDAATTLTGRAVVRAAWEAFTVRTTLSGEVSGLGDPVTRSNGKASIALNYSGAEGWRPSLTYSADQSTTTHTGVGSATSTDHRVVGRSTWTGEEMSNTLSLSVRVRNTGGSRRITGTVENSYELDLGETLAGWMVTEDAEAVEDAGVRDPYPAATLRVDASGDYRWDGTEVDADLTVAARLDVALSEMWGGSLSTSYLTGTKNSGGLYHSYLLELTVSVDF